MWLFLLGFALGLLTRPVVTLIRKKYGPGGTIPAERFRKPPRTMGRGGQ